MAPNTTGSRNYYGEYSLEQWIKLMLSKEIILPPYQRAFVWTEEDVRELINSLQKGLFVPPITIGNYGGMTNYILDGQQRLSAILIAYLGLFPKGEAFPLTGQEYRPRANDNDDKDDDSDETTLLGWQFNSFTQKGKDKKTILDNIDKQNYKELPFAWDNAFWKNTYIGFSLIVPISNEEIEQQKLYTSVFRNINIKGKPLSNAESRKALYFLRDSFDQWFSPSFANGITSQGKSIDFVRYLSLLSQYKKVGRASQLARGHKTRMEQYYESYVCTEVNKEDGTTFTRLLDSAPQPRYDELKRNLHTEDFPKAYTSIIEADLYLFGLIYYTIAEHSSISITENLLSQIASKIQEFKEDANHAKSPSAFKYLYLRVQASIDIYSQHLISSSDEA